MYFTVYRFRFLRRAAVLFFFLHNTQSFFPVFPCFLLSIHYTTTPFYAWGWRLLKCFLLFFRPNQHVLCPSAISLLSEHIHESWEQITASNCRIDAHTPVPNVQKECHWHNGGACGETNIISFKFVSWLLKSWNCEGIFSEVSLDHWVCNGATTTIMIYFINNSSPCNRLCCWDLSERNDSHIGKHEILPCFLVRLKRML